MCARVYVCDVSLSTRFPVYIYSSSWCCTQRDNKQSGLNVFCPLLSLLFFLPENFEWQKKAVCDLIILFYIFYISDSKAIRNHRFEYGAQIHNMSIAFLIFLGIGKTRHIYWYITLMTDYESFNLKIVFSIADRVFQYTRNLFDLYLMFYFILFTGSASVTSPIKVRQRCCVRPCRTINSRNSSRRVARDTTIIRIHTDTSHCPPRRPVGRSRAKTKCRPAQTIYRHTCSPCSTYLGPTIVWTWYVIYSIVYIYI